MKLRIFEEFLAKNPPQFTGFTLVDENGRFVACGNDRKRLEEIIAAANHHDKLVETLKSIIEWWEDDHDFPASGAKIDPAEACQWYKRRMYLIAEAARAALTKLDAEAHNGR